MKKYFIRRVGKMHPAVEVTREEYLKCASQQFFSVDRPTFLRILESAPKRAPCCSNLMLFWTEDVDG